jgi:pimeloyl-ACP methyl ester carboxylesterase
MQQGQMRIFLPGFGARAASYAEGLPSGWLPLQPPPPSVTRGRLDDLGVWLAEELVRRPRPTIVAGHSMGAALAILAAARYPHSVSRLVLVAPAGLPLTKPVRQSAADFVRQLCTGTHMLRDAASSTAELAAAPRSTFRLIRAFRRLDLREEMALIRRQRTPVTVIGCDSDTLTPPRHCRDVADLLGGSYRELRLDGGHVWMFGRWPVLANALESATGSRGTLTCVEAEVVAAAGPRR